MITNQCLTKVRRKLPLRLSILYQPRDMQWTYSHHAAICKFMGKWYAMWSNGERDEDNLRQRVLYAVSEDGVNWSSHRVLYPSEEGSVLTACGFHQHNGTLVAYAGSFGYAPENVENGHYKTINDFHQRTTLLARTTRDGEHWSDVIDLKVPMVANHGPTAIKGGRLILSGGVLFPWTDDPSGLSGWQLTGLPPFPWPDMFDDSQGVLRHVALRQDGAFLCEGSFFQTEDETLHMLLRSDQCCLYESVSHDRGESWSDAQPTNFRCANAKCHMGQLPDGRYFHVGNPDPAARRCPLVLTLSRDGVTFDQEYIIDETVRPLRKQGLYKGGIYGYPHTLIDGDTMYVICSINKEDIHVYTIDLKTI